MCKDSITITKEQFDKAVVEIMQAPCKDCPERHMTCHERCEKYLAYRQERDACNQRRALERRDENISIESALRRKKSRRRRPQK